jgi:hypothetical protein
MTETVIVQLIEPTTLVVTPQEATIVVSSPGPQGPAGIFNPADIFYTHIQAIAASVWTINHNLGGYPTAVILDSAGTQCEGTFSYPSINQMVITFTGAFTGTGYII